MPIKEGEIGHHQAMGKPLTLKQLFLLDIGLVDAMLDNVKRLDAATQQSSLKTLRVFDIRCFSS